MNQAVNNFGKGLQTDTHPMIQGTDTLSDCLNGTLITMNGNEVILQNDMGNRRVNNAFLPSGYQPVGMKEYGGVIYVAAYNPITNKSQIGSFPSPQRNINNEINKELLGNEFQFEKVLQVGTGNEKGLNTYKHSLERIVKDVIFLDNDVFLIPLTSDIVIHAGDKFVVSAKDLESIGEEYITNYRNVNPGTEESPNTTKAISPKNRRFTLSLGILNSQNEFVDITKTLCRWEKDENRDWSIKKYSSEYSDVFKFNDGYFIPDEFDNSSLDETIEDSRLIGVRKINRQILEANTYAYKLIGPLYLKVALNHIETFSFSIYGVSNNDTAQQNSSNSRLGPRLSPQLSLSDEQNTSLNNVLGEYFPITFIDDNQNNESGGSGEGGSGGQNQNGADEGTRNVNLQIDAFITYNCPDGVDGSSLDGNQDYETFDEGKPDFRMFDLIDGLNEETDKIRKPTSTIIRKSVYNPNNNLYSLKLTKKYNGITSDSSQYNYFLGVLADKKQSERGNFNIPPVYLKGLSVEGTIDLDLLGSGRVTGDAWRFFNKVDGNKINTQLSIGLNAYIEPNTTYTNLRFKFVDMSDNKEYFGPLAPGTSFSIYSTEINGSEEQVPIFTSTIDTNIGINTVITTQFNESNFKSVKRPHEASDFEFENSLPTRAAFRVYTYIDKYDETSGEYEHTMLQFGDYIDDESRWFLSTELFNEFFNKVQNFCSVEITQGNDGYNKDFADKMIVALDLLSESSKTQTETSEFEGSLVSKDSQDINYKCNNSINFDVNYESKVTIKNKDQYPKFVDDIETWGLAAELKKIRVRFPNTNTFNDFDIWKDANNETLTNINNEVLNNKYQSEMRTDRKDGEIFTTEGDFTDSRQFNNLFSLTDITDSDGEEGKRKVTGTINHNDILAGGGENKVQKADIFDNFFDYLQNQDNFDQLIGHFGVILNYQKSGNNHYADIVCSLQGDNTGDNYPAAGNWWTERISCLDLNPDTRIKVGDRESAVLMFYNRSIDYDTNMTIEKCIQEYGKNIDNYEGSSKLFGYIFSPNRGNKNYDQNEHMKCTVSDSTEMNNKNGRHEIDNCTDNERCLGYKFARVWWRTSLNEWALFDQLLEKDNQSLNGNITSEQFVLFLKNNVNMRDYVYCINNNYNFDDNYNFYSIKENPYKYINSHNLTVYIGFIFQLAGSTGINTTFPSHGNLQFKFNPDSSNINELAFNLKSNTNFYNTIYRFEQLNIIPIYIKTGLICDMYGNVLDSDRVYYLDNGNLKSDTTYVSKSGQMLLCTNNGYTTTQAPLYRYDHLGDDTVEESGPETYVDYNGVNLVNLEYNNV